MTLTMTNTTLLIAAAVALLGFTTTFSITPECMNVNIMTDETGDILSSPHYGQSLYGNVNCEWHISTGSNSSMVVVEVVLFDLDESTSNCTSDYVAVYDGHSRDSPRIRLLCGSIEYGNFNSTNSDLTIIFHSDGLEDSSKGFILKFQAKKKSNRTVDPCTDISLTAIETPKYFLSPNYPDWYPSNMNCKWNIIAYSHSMTVMLVFKDFVLEMSPPSCTHDYLEIYDGGLNKTSNQIKLFCGNKINIQEQYLSTYSSIIVVFHSDGENNYKGFNITYQTFHKPSAGGSDNTIGIIVGVLCIVGVVCFIITFVTWVRKKCTRRQQ